MDGDHAIPCRNCQRLQAQVDVLQAQVQELQANFRHLQENFRQTQQELAETRQELARTQEQLAKARKDSSTSSKPPSSDLVKPPKPGPAGGGKRRRGGQPGHPRHERELFPPERLSGDAVRYPLELCPDCGHGLHEATCSPRIVQQVEIEVMPLCITEHRAEAGYCPHCRKVHYAALPPDVAKGGMAGPRLTTFIAYLKGACHASFSTIRKFLRDVLCLTISRGQLVKIIAKVTQALDEPYQELLERLPQESRLNVDETGHKDGKEKWWTWCFRASVYTLFKIDATRSAAVLLDLLGAEFNGVLGCDYFSAYRRYMRICAVVVQFCLPGGAGRGNDVPPANGAMLVRVLVRTTSPATIAISYPRERLPLAFSSVKLKSFERLLHGWANDEAHPRRPAVRQTTPKSRLSAAVGCSGRWPSSRYSENSGQLPRQRTLRPVLAACGKAVFSEYREHGHLLPSGVGVALLRIGSAKSESGCSDPTWRRRAVQQKDA